MRLDDLSARLLALPGEVWLGLAAGLGVGLAISAIVLLARRRPRAWQLADTFGALAAEALHRNNESFLALAGERLRAEQEAAASTLDGRHKAIEALVAPLHDALDAVQSEARALERARLEQSGSLRQQVESLATQTVRLTEALRSPGARGRWGELTLRRTAELAGLTPHCDFAEQTSLAGGARPDMVVRLPAGRAIAVDAKAPLDAWLDAAEAETDADRVAALARHARSLRRHVEALASRDYAAQLARAPEFVVLFLPDDGFIAGAVQADRNLVEHSLGRGVVLATPSTLYALLGAVAQGWREARLAQSTHQILGLARELDERLCTFAEHLGRMGSALRRSVEHYNAAVGSFDARILPQARRLRELGVDGRKELAAASPIDTAPRVPVKAD